MLDGFISLPRFLRFGHRLVTVSSNLSFSYRPRQRLGHLEALLSLSVTQLTLPSCNAQNLSIGLAVLLPTVRPDWEGLYRVGLHLFI